jgi:hypothetical protein
MADSEVFDFVCEQLEQRTSLDRLEARGTVRLTLKQAGLDARGVSAQQMAVAVDKLLAGELESRGVDGAAGHCAGIKSELGNLDVAPSGETPEAVFERLGG